MYHAKSNFHKQLNVTIPHGKPGRPAKAHPYLFQNAIPSTTTLPTIFYIFPMTRYWILLGPSKDRVLDHKINTNNSPSILLKIDTATGLL